jgi:hypothetical protein
MELFEGQPLSAVATAAGGRLPPDEVVPLMRDVLDILAASHRKKGLDAAESGKTFSTISMAAFALGVVGVSAGTYLVLSSRGGTRMDARWLVNGAGASLEGTF